MNDLWIAGFAAFVGIIMFLSQWRKAKKYREKLTQLLYRHTFEKFDRSSKIKMAYIFLIAVFLGIFVWGINIRNTAMIAMGILMDFIFCGELMLVPENYIFWFNKRACILNGEMIEYTSIRSVEPKTKLGVKGLEIKTFTGKTITVPPAAEEILSRKLMERGSRKHGRSSGNLSFKDSR